MFIFIDEGVKYIERIDYISKTANLNNANNKYNDNSNTCILIVSGNYSNMGVITNVNNEITRLTGLNKNDLIG